MRCGMTLFITTIVVVIHISSPAFPFVHATPLNNRPQQHIYQVPSAILLNDTYHDSILVSEINNGKVDHLRTFIEYHDIGSGPYLEARAVSSVLSAAVLYLARLQPTTPFDGLNLRLKARGEPRHLYQVLLKLLHPNIEGRGGALGESLSNRDVFRMLEDVLSRVTTRLRQHVEENVSEIRIEFVDVAAGEVVLEGGVRFAR